ncbi:MAG: hypothetical protein M3332_15205, partial [Actinomycetota bacterium]|nr:hypothetical protein [Actinomycetota bacterium]
GAFGGEADPAGGRDDPRGVGDGQHRGEPDAEPADALRAGRGELSDGQTSRQAGYARRPEMTINHAVSVLSAFYDFHLLSEPGPVVSPVPPQSRDGHRLQGHHNPLEPFRLHRRGAYRQKQPEEVVEDMFKALDCNRDCALFAMFLSSGARAGELLGDVGG